MTSQKNSGLLGVETRCATTATLRSSTIGGSLLGIGMVASVGHVVAEFGVSGIYAAAHLPDSTVRALDRANDHVLTVNLVIGLFVTGLLLGAILLVVGPRRSRRIPIWAAIAGIVYFVAMNMSTPAMGVVELVASLVFYVAAALSLAGGAGSDLRDDPAEQLAQV